MPRPFVPTKDFDHSKQFYLALGFSVEHSDLNVAVMEDGTVSFILQNFYVRGLAENLMLQLVVDDVDAWWSERNPEKAAEAFSTNPPTPPAIQAWGMKVGFIQDSSGVLWHIAQSSIPAV